MADNKLVDLFDKYRKSDVFGSLDALDRQGMINVEPKWQHFLAKQGLANASIGYDKFGDLCVEFMKYLLSGGN